MDRLHVHIVAPEEEGIRLDVLLSRLPFVSSRSAAAKLIETQAATLNEQAASKNHRVQEGDVIEYEVEEVVQGAPLGEHIALDIRYEDEHLIVLSKQADLVCHPSTGHESGTLVNALIQHCGIENLGMLQGEDRPGIVHRLDKDTTGLMLAAKTDEAQAALQDGIRIRSIDRRYLALVHGDIAPDTGLIDAPIARAPKMRMRMEVSESPNARSSVTTFTVLERIEAAPDDQGYTLVECKLYTGRTHQIRVHMAYIHHPCVGDELYGSKHVQADRWLQRQFLHSYRLEFDHPITGEHLVFIDPLPDDLAGVLATLHERSFSRTQRGEELASILSGG